MKKRSENQHGRFLWLPDAQRQEYVQRLKKRIQDGYYSSERVAVLVTEKLAHAFDSEIDRAM